MSVKGVEEESRGELGEGEEEDCQLEMFGGREGRRSREEEETKAHLPEIDMTCLSSSSTVSRSRGDGEAGELLRQRNLLMKLLLRSTKAKDESTKGQLCSSFLLV